jgi:predicted ATPase
MMVVGEPGIGKTAVCEQLSTYATLRGGKTLVGHCYEEGSLSLPYLAFVEAMRSYVLSRDTRSLRRELGTGAADVARIVSEIRDKLKIQVKPQGSREEERYRLMQGVTAFLTNAAKAEPLLIVLEDLHDADQGTLEMLTHASRNISDARLLIVGTYRDVEVDRAHPLSAALAELRRTAAYDRVLLRGLNADEVQRMMSGVAGQDVPWGLSEAVYRQTEGNPLFVQEMLRYLRDSGLATREDGRWQPISQAQLEMSIPEGLRDVIGKRLSYLSPECNRILSTAAVIGREFRLEVLQRVADVSEDDLFAALEGARRAVVVEERSIVGSAVTYRFTHAFFRQTLYEETIAPRRIRLHQQVAQVLEEVYAGRLEEHAAGLAEHFSYCSDPTDLAKAVSYGEMAAERATSVYAWGEAVRLLEQALKVQEVLGPDDKEKRFDVLLALAEALRLAGQPRRALDAELPEAFSLAEAIADSSRASRASWQAHAALHTYRVGTAYALPEAAEWAERADRHALPETPERVQADVALGAILCATVHPEEGVPLLRRALELSRRLGDQRTFRYAASAWLNYAQTPPHVDELRSVVDELTLTSRVGLDIHVLAGYLYNQAAVFLLLGERERSEQAWREMSDMAERTGQPTAVLLAMVGEATVRLMDGRLEEAIEITRRVMATGRELGMLDYAAVFATGLGLRPRALIGKADGALRRAKGPAEMASDHAAATFCLAHLGHAVETREKLQQFVVARPNIGSDQDETFAYRDALMLEAAVIVGHDEAANLLVKRFAGKGLRTTGLFYITCVDRHLGAATAMLGRSEDARAHYHDALKVATDMRFRPEIALTRLQLAELLLDHYPDEKVEALEHLDFAIGEFREMKMQPSLERALRHKEILGA